jgi:hypothetical protein
MLMFSQVAGKREAENHQVLLQNLAEAVGGAEFVPSPESETVYSDSGSVPSSSMPRYES